MQFFDQSTKNGSVQEIHIAIIGADGSGKSALTVKYMTRRYISEYDPNIEDTYCKHETIDGKEFMVWIMDTVEGRGEHPSRYLGWADVFLVVYAVNNKRSFDYAEKLLRIIAKHDHSLCNRQHAVCVLGNKSDLDRYRQVGKNQGEQMASDYGAEFFETNTTEEYSLLQNLLPSNSLKRKSAGCPILHNDRFIAPMKRNEMLAEVQAFNWSNQLNRKQVSKASVERWRSDKALHNDAAPPGGKNHRRLNARSASPSNSRQRPAKENRYCPVCRKFRNRNYGSCCSPQKSKPDDHHDRVTINKSSIESELRKLRDRLKEAEERTVDFENRLRDISKDNEILRADNSRLKEENENLRQQLNSQETNLLRCENRLSKSSTEKRQYEDELQKLTEKNDSLVKEINEIRRGMSKSNGAASAAVRWRSDEALDRDSDTDGLDRGRRPNSRVRANTNNTRTVSPLAKNRTALSATNRYCPVCRKFRSRNYVCTNIANFDSSEMIRRRQRITADTTCDSGFTDRDSSPEQRSVEVRRRLARLNDDLMKLSEENRRLNDELHKLRVDKAVHDTEKHGSRRLFEEQRDELRIVRQENAELRAKLSVVPNVPVTQPAYQTGVGQAKLTRVSLAPNEKARYERIQHENEELKSEVSALRLRFETDKSRHDHNSSLLNIQRNKIEQDNANLKANNESLTKSNDFLQNQLRQLDERLKDMQREMADQKVTVKERDGRERTLAYVNDLQNNLSDLNAKFRHSESIRINLEKKLNEINTLADNVTTENSRLKAKLTSAEQDVLRLEGELGSHNLRTTEFEKQLASKDRDISRLKNIIRDLEDEYEKFRKSLAEQEGNLNRLQRDLAVTGNLKDQAEKTKAQTLDDFKRMQDQFQKMQSDNVELKRELELALEEQDKLKRIAQRHLNDIHTYEKLLSEREKEKMQLISHYQESTNEIRRIEAQHTSAESQISLEAQAQRWQLNQAKDQINSLKSENDKLLREQSLLKDQMKKCESTLDQLQNSLDGARAQNDSLQSDLVSIRQTAIKMDSVKMQLVQELSEKDCELQKAQRVIDDLILELELVRSQITKEQHSLNQIDSALQEARDAQLKAQVDAQQKMEETRYMRERIAEYELKLELQGKDLTNLRAKLTRAESEIQQLRRQLIDEQSS